MHQFGRKSHCLVKISQNDTSFGSIRLIPIDPKYTMNIHGPGQTLIQNVRKSGDDSQYPYVCWNRKTPQPRYRNSGAWLARGVDPKILKARTPFSHGSFGDMKNIESLSFPTTGIYQTSTAMFTRNPMVQVLARPVVIIHFELQNEI